MNTMRTLRILGLFSLMLAGVAVSNITQAQPGFSVSFETFYNDLSPYGRWIRNPQYGSVWIPDVPRGFQPYSTNGYWEVTEYGNTWVSDYDWGWAPFHYGRWSFDDYNGWFWIPDYEWGPAWVNWRSGGGYYGWAPLGPGVSINVSFNAPSFWWNFVPQRYITYRGWRNYCAPQRRFTHVYNQTVIINNYYRSNNRTYVYGPRRDEIERVTRRSVPVRTIDASANGRGRVIVAESSRGNDRYNSRDNNRNPRNEPERRGAVIDASPERNDRSGNTPRNPSENRSEARPSRDRTVEPSIPTESRNEREVPRQSQPAREPSIPASRPSRSNEPAPSRGSNEAPQRPNRVERSAEPRANERKERPAQPSPQRSTTERSSRSPR